MTKPNQKFCRAKNKHAAAAGCTLLVGHTGDHLTATKGAFGPKAQTWTDEKGKVNDWPLCGERCPSTPEWRCARPDEHDGPHGAITIATTGIAEWSEVIEWNDGARRLNHLRSRDVVAGLLNGAPREDVGDRDVKPSNVSIVDKCGKCGFELGQHEGTKCPKNKYTLERHAAVFALVAGAPGIKADQLAPIHRGVLAELERADRIVYRNGGWYPSPSEDGAPNISTLPEGACLKCGAIGEHEVLCPAAPCPVSHETGVRCAGLNRHAGAHADENGRTWASASAKLVTPTPKGTKPAQSKKPTKQKAPAVMKPAKAPPAKPELEQVPASNARILGFKVHPVAAKYPLIDGSDFVEFCDDIRANGQRDKIVLVDIGKDTFILDGRNRGRACEVLKIKPRLETYTGPTDHASLKAFVISKNDHRRHYSKGVRAMIAADVANLGHGQKQTGKSAGVTQAEAAKIEHVSEKLVRLATAVKNKGTDKLREAVMRDKIALDVAADAALKLPVAKQNEIAEKALAKGDNAGPLKSGVVRMLVRQEEKRAVVAKINKGQVRPLTGGPYRLIYIDPPWQYENNDQHEGSKAHTPYPTLPMERIHKIGEDIKRVSLDEELVLAMWVTNAFMWAIGDVLRAWGFERNDSSITWDKGHPGVGRTGPRGQTEHLVLAWRKGAKHTLNELPTIIEAPRREHSRKPDKFADLLRQHCAGPHLEMFAQEEREGWEVWGAETNKYEADAA